MTVDARKRLFRYCLGGWGCLVLAFLCLPIVLVLPISFSAGTFLNYPLPGLSLRWYATVLQPYPWMFALKNSLVVGSLTTVLAVVLGTLASYGLTFTDFRGKQLVLMFLITPMVVPVVIIGLAIYFLLSRIGLLGSFAGLVLAHTVLALPFVVITVTATLQGFDKKLIKAAASLGCPPLRTFLSVTLPLILPGVISGAIFAFATSFDEVVVALFVSAPSQLTLPRQLFSGLRDQVDPAIVAIATLLIAISCGLMIAMELLRARTERMRGRSANT